MPPPFFSFSARPQRRRCLLVASPLASSFVDVDGEILDRRCGALRFLRARAATFARADVNVSAIASAVSAVVELLACGTKVAVACGKISETFGAVERTVFGQSTSRLPPSCRIRCTLPGSSASHFQVAHDKLCAIVRNRLPTRRLPRSLAGSKFKVAHYQIPESFDK
jgi:hypothetical protein